MNTVTAIWTFSIAAALATMTPGLDTALVLRAATVEGKRRAAMAALGIAAGVLAWGSATAFGVAELIRASALAYEIVRWTGAAYLLYLGAGMLLRPRTEFSSASTAVVNGRDKLSAPQLSGAKWFTRGFLTNLLNPKVGVFYVSFLPQFIPHAATNPRALMLLFAMIHAVQAVLWFSALIVAAKRLAPVLRQGRVVKLFDRAMGTLFIGFSIRLALEKQA